MRLGLLFFCVFLTSCIWGFDVSEKKVTQGPAENDVILGKVVSMDHMDIDQKPFQIAGLLDEQDGTAENKNKYYEIRPQNYVDFPASNRCFIWEGIAHSDPDRDNQIMNDIYYIAQLVQNYKDEHGLYPLAHKNGSELEYPVYSLINWWLDEKDIEAHREYLGTHWFEKGSNLFTYIKNDLGAKGFAFPYPCEAIYTYMEGGGYYFINGYLSEPSRYTRTTNAGENKIEISFTSPPGTRILNLDSLAGNEHFQNIISQAEIQYPDNLD